MFKQCIFFIILIVVTYFVVKAYLLKNHKLIVTDKNVKYMLSKKDETFLKKYGKKTKINELEPESFFYSTEPWSTKNNNYMLFNDRYYIVEPGYYYHINKDSKTFFNETFVYGINCIKKI